MALATQRVNALCDEPIVMLSNLYSFLFIFVFISIIRASCFCFYNSIISFGVVVWFLFAASRLWLVPVIKRPSTLQRYSSIFIYSFMFFCFLRLHSCNNRTSTSNPSQFAFIMWNFMLYAIIAYTRWIVFLHSFHQINL